MKSIASIHSRLKLALSKETGKYYTPEELDQELHSESMNLFNKYYDRYPESQKEASYLAPFIVTTTLDYDSNLVGFPKPEAMVHPILLATDSGTALHLTEHGHWINKVNDPLTGPADDHPLIRIDSDKMVVLPATITKIQIHYLKKPEEPKWAYNKNGTQYEYIDANSVDMGWDDVVNDQIINRVLTNLGIAQREPELVEYGLTNQQIEEV